MKLKRTATVLILINRKKENVFRYQTAVETKSEKLFNMFRLTSMVG